MQSDVPPLEGEAALNPAAWERHGEELEFYGHLGEAIEAYAEAQRRRVDAGLALDPHLGKLAGNCHARLGRDQSALDCYLWAQQQYAAQGLGPDPGLSLNIGNSYQRLEDYTAADEAYAAHERELAQCGEQPDHSLFKNRGALRVCQGRFDEALTLLDEAVARRAAAGLRPDSELALNRGAALRGLGRLEESLAALQESDELSGGTSWPVAYQRAKTLEAQGEFAAAGTEGLRAQNLFMRDSSFGDHRPPADLQPLVERCNAAWLASRREE